MANTNLDRPFTPDWASPPGNTIADALEELGWSQSDLAQRLGYTEKHVSQLITAKVPITEESAQKLARVIGSTANFWLRLEAQYQAQLVYLAEKEKLQTWTPWLDQIPVKALMTQGAIPKRRLDQKNKPQVVKDLLQFFGVAEPTNWQAYYGGKQLAFRRSSKRPSDLGAITAWLRLGEIIGQKTNLPRYNRTKFQQALKEMRQLTCLEPTEFVLQLRELCAEAGVVFAIVPAIPGAHTSGVARWLTPHKPLIQLSLYGKQNDRFWFTFFHEAAHILFHSKKDIFLDDTGGSEDLESEIETEASQWARQILIPEIYDAELPSLTDEAAVVAFAARLGIHSGIVVGRLQHDQIIDHRSPLNRLKVSLDLVNS